MERGSGHNISFYVPCFLYTCPDCALLREFPRSILYWPNYYNTLFSCFFICKWAPWSVLHKPFVTNATSGSAACKFNYVFIGYFTMTGLVACNTLIAVTIYIIIKINTSILETHHAKYYASYISFVILYPLLTGLVAAFAFDKVALLGETCGINENFNDVILVLPYFIFLIFQVVLIGKALTTLKTMLDTSRNRNTSTHFALKYLFIRFIATFIAQLYNCFPTQIYFLFPEIGRNNESITKLAFVTRASGGAIDAIVLIFGNADVINWLQVIYNNYFQSFPHSGLNNDNEHSPHGVTDTTIARVTDKNGGAEQIPTEPTEVPPV